VRILIGRVFFEQRYLSVQWPGRALVLPTFKQKASKMADKKWSQAESLFIINYLRKMSDHFRDHSSNF